VSKLIEEQVIGQILLLLQELHEWLGELERREVERRREGEGGKLCSK
jgi:hypothetical protein